MDTDTQTTTRSPDEAAGGGKESLPARRRRPWSRRAKQTRGMGYRAMPSVEAALKDAERYVGTNPRILATPECYSGGMAVNLAASNRSR